MPIPPISPRSPDLEPPSSATGPSTSRYYDKNKNNNIKRDMYNLDKVAEKKMREDMAAITDYCIKHGIPVGDEKAMLEVAKEKLRLGQSRKAPADEKDIKDRTVLVNPKDPKTIAIEESVKEAFRSQPTPRSLEPGRVKEEKR